MKRMLTLLLALYLVSTPAGISYAQPSCADGSAHAFLNLTTAATSGDGCSVVFDGELATVSVVVSPHVPMTKVRFSIQDPSFGIIVDATWNYPAVGEPQTGVEITLPECTMGPTTVLGDLVVLANDFPAIDGLCATWQVDDFPEIDDCDGNARPALARHHEFSTLPDGCCFYIDCAAIPPYDLFPADGATDVPANAMLTWVGGSGFTSIEIGTDAECFSGQVFDLNDAHDFTPDFLEPNTTYYWQVGWSDGVECGGTSPRFSFTTGTAPVPTEEATWGRIKALYD